MTYKILIYTIFLCTCYSCCIQGIQIREKQISEEKIVEPSTYECNLTALNLTEDVSRVSTKNDEIILLVYQENTLNEIPELIYQDYFIIDHVKSHKKFLLNDSLLNNTFLILFLLEIDTRKTLQQIEPVVRLNLDAIENSIQDEDTKIVRDLLGDDDLIGIERVSMSDVKKKNQFIEFKGIHIIDSYYYRIEIKKHNN